MSESESERVKVDTRCMNGKFRFLNLKFMKKKKKEHEDAMILFKLRGSWKAT